MIRRRGHGHQRNKLPWISQPLLHPSTDRPFNHAVVRDDLLRFCIWIDKGFIPPEHSSFKSDRLYTKYRRVSHTVITRLWLMFFKQGVGGCFGAEVYDYDLETYTHIRYGDWRSVYILP